MPGYFGGIPSLIRIGPHEVVVQIVKKVDKKNSCGCWRTGLIQLRRDHRSRQYALDTLIHEILHGIIEYSKLDTTEEEDIVEKTATWLVAVFLDNPKLLQWIVQCVVDDQR